ncbi:MAG: hypothetical protein QM619_06895 [Micropruina sp.]
MTLSGSGEIPAFTGMTWAGVTWISRDAANAGPSGTDRTGVID